MHMLRSCYFTHILQPMNFQVRSEKSEEDQI